MAHAISSRLSSAEKTSVSPGLAAWREGVKQRTKFGEGCKGGAQGSGRRALLPLPCTEGSVTLKVLMSLHATRGQERSSTVCLGGFL